MPALYFLPQVFQKDISAKFTAVLYISCPKCFKKTFQLLSCEISKKARTKAGFDSNPPVLYAQKNHPNKHAVARFDVGAVLTNKTGFPKRTICFHRIAPRLLPPPLSPAETPPSDFAPNKT